mmetsp:Transcript_33695/g.85163  ORF Transcript_33695/g.85163 Transcript_33695/m.85163 type:complete len:205 (+) Transcript_33695:2329-2943(+)
MTKVNLSLANPFLDTQITTFLVGPSLSSSSGNFVSISSYSSLKRPWPGSREKAPRRTEDASINCASFFLAGSKDDRSKRTSSPTSMHCLRSSISSSSTAARRSSRALSCESSHSSSSWASLERVGNIFKYSSLIWAFKRVVICLSNLANPTPRASSSSLMRTWSSSLVTSASLSCSPFLLRGKGRIKPKFIVNFMLSCKARWAS